MPVIPEWKCLHCGYEWVGRSAGMPRQCPACKSPRWNRPALRQGTRYSYDNGCKAVYYGEKVIIPDQVSKDMTTYASEGRSFPVLLGDKKIRGVVVDPETASKKMATVKAKEYRKLK